MQKLILKPDRESNGDANDQYTGLDRFGRVVDQRWIKDNDVSNPLDRFQYGYDRNGNRLYHEYKFDVVGRMTEDQVSILGYLVNGAVRRLGPKRRSGSSGDGTASPLVDTSAVDQFTRTFREQHRGAWMEVDHLGGFCLLLKRTLLDALGPLPTETGLSIFGGKRGRSSFFP